MQISPKEINTLVIFITLVFLLAPSFLLIYINLYNRRKNRHIEEKAIMKLTFEAEITQTQYEVQEQTMQTIGTDLHDNIGQLLSLTALTLNSIELDNEAKSRQKIDAAIDLTVRSIKELRLLGKLLQGDQLVVTGLPEAIRYEISWLEKSGKYKVNYIDEGDVPENNNADKDLILFRVMQEILNNIIKHAQATVIDIRLTYSELHLQLQIKDNGIGFTTGDKSGQHGMGLKNMQKRAAIIGGEVYIESTPGAGTSITIFIPYP